MQEKKEAKAKKVREKEELKAKEKNSVIVKKEQNPIGKIIK